MTIVTIAIIILAITVVLLKNFKLHLVINIAMYFFYIYLWIERFFPPENIRPAYIGFSLFIMTISTAPIYTLYHISSIIYSGKDKKILWLNVAGLTLCLLQLAFVFSMI